MAHQRWQAVEDTLKRYWYQIDIQAVQAQLACIAAHFLTDYPPAWLLAIAPAGSAKTVVLEAVDKLPYFHQIDQFTPNTFISGLIDDDKPTPFSNLQKVKRKTEEVASYDSTIVGYEQALRNMTCASLLNRIGPSGIVTIPDFSTILQKRQDVRDDIFAQLRRIYDGTLRREFGTAGRLCEREWHGRITALAAVTPEIDHYHNVFIALGERWMRIRWSRVSGLGAGLTALDQTEEVFARLQYVIRELLMPYINRIPRAPSIPDSIKQRLINLSDLVCIARAHVHRDSEGEVDCEPAPESNTRLPKTLAQVMRGWTALMGKAECDEEAFALAERIAWDCIPPMRKHVFECVRLNRPRHIKGLSSNGVMRATKELVALGLIAPIESEEVSIPELTELAKDMYRAVRKQEAKVHIINE